MTQRLITIGGVGGSGTRAVIRLLRQVGVYTGVNVNRALDSLDFQYTFMVPWLRSTLRAWLGDALPLPVTKQQADFERFLAEHLSGAEDAEVVAWKHPRVQYCLPTLRQVRPDLAFVHLIRDGRDMVLSANQHQRDDFAPVFLSEPELDRSLQVQSQLVWARGNDLVADYGERHMGDDYLRVRFEDLCFHPERVIGEILDFAGIGRVTPELVSEIQPPESIGRWRTGDLDVFEDEFAAALERYGYTGDFAAPQPDTERVTVTGPVTMDGLRESGLSDDVVVVGGYHKYAPGVVTRILRLGDRFMGARHLDRDLFATDFGDVARDWRRRVLRAWLADEEVPRLGDLEDRWAEAIAHHFDGMELGRPWGYADQHAVEMLPAIDAVMPGVRFVHLVVDPRTRPNLDGLLPGWARSAAFRAGWDGFRAGRWSELWAEMNRRAADYGEQTMGERYLLVRVEDLVADPETWVDRISRFAGHGPATPEMVSEMWLEAVDANREIEVAPGSELAGGLARFGYADPSLAQPPDPVAGLQPHPGTSVSDLFDAGLSDDVVVAGGYHIFGLGVVMRALRMSGRFMGNDGLGPDLTPRGFPRAISGVRQAVFESWLGDSALPLADAEPRLREFVARHVAGTDPSGPWGWVDRRSLDVLPLLDALLPGMRFVHMVSDPRTRPDANAPLPEWALAAAARAGFDGFASGSYVELWAQLNLMAADYGESRMGGRYVRVKVEDLASDPERWMGEIAAVAGCKATPAMLAETELLNLRAGAAWSGEPPPLLSEAIERFGY